MKQLVPGTFPTKSIKMVEPRFTALDEEQKEMPQPWAKGSLPNWQTDSEKNESKNRCVDLCLFHLLNFLIKNRVRISSRTYSWLYMICSFYLQLVDSVWASQRERLPCWGSCHGLHTGPHDQAGEISWTSGTGHLCLKKVGKIPFEYIWHLFTSLNWDLFKQFQGYFSVLSCWNDLLDLVINVCGFSSNPDHMNDWSCPGGRKWCTSECSKTFG